MAAPQGAYNPPRMTSLARAEALGLDPSSCVAGTFHPGGSKSLAQRALLLAAVARGCTRIEGLSAADDVRAALALLRAIGVEASEPVAGAIAVEGAPPTPDGGLAGGRIEVGESGTLARLATGLLALASRPGASWTIQASGTLLFRRSLPLFRALAEAGVACARQNLPGTWPVELISRAPPASLQLRAPVSSQEVSALAVGLAAHAGERSLLVEGEIPSAPYLAMTAGLLARFGAGCIRSARAEGGHLLRVRGPLRAPSDALVLEPDASSAAVALAAACLSGGELRVPGLTSGSAQGDVKIVAHLAAFGCQARFVDGGIAAHGFPVRGAELDCTGEPDLAPVLAVVAAGAALRNGAASTLTGLGTLPGKESDRLALLARALGALGLAVEAGVDWLRIGPPVSAGAEAVLLDPRSDHRMVFACALLGLLRPGVRVRDAQCVRKSWPTFWADLEHLGARLAPG